MRKKSPHVLLAVSTAVTIVLMSQAASAQADEAWRSEEALAKTARDPRADLPVTAFAYAAQGAPKGAAGAQVFALSLLAKDQSAVLGGGASVWGSPWERVTLLGDAQRNIYGNFSPSAAVLVHALGNRSHGWSLGGLAKFKIDGFASGPSKDEIESELELGALVSFAEPGGFRLDLNAIFGRGLGDDGETDTEARARFGRSLGESFWLGVDGQLRVRVNGPRALPNGRTWDFAAGPQLLFGAKNFFAVLTAGPATVGLSTSNVGFTSMLGIGGTT